MLKLIEYAILLKKIKKLGDGLNIKHTVDNYYTFISPFLILLTTISSAFTTYQVDKAYKVKHPIRYELYIFLIDWAPVVLIIAGILLCIVMIINSVNRKTVRKLSDELEQKTEIVNSVRSNIKELFDGYLYHFASKKLSFSSSDRITLYIHNGNNTFIPFGRFSTNPKFAKPGRREYPDNEGCISHGWENDWFFDNDFSSSNFRLRSKDTYNMNIDVTKKLKMQSMLFAVKRIKNVNGDPLGVMVIESIKNTRYNEKQAKKLLTEQEDYIAEMISRFSKYIPQTSEAKAKGL